MDWTIVEGIGLTVLIWSFGCVSGMAWMGVTMTNQRLKEGVCPCQN